MTLSRDESRRFYDRFGSKQDAQGFYEDRALRALIDNARFDEAGTVFEFGCGTGRLAEALLSDVLASDARYVGCDLSDTMVRLASARLERFGERARIVPATDDVAFPVADGWADRILATYVLDLLDERDTEAFVREARRALATHGRLCVAGLTWGTTIVSRIVASAWFLAYRVRPALVGGCRPVVTADALADDGWTIGHRHVVVSWGVASEVVVAGPDPSGSRAGE